MDNFKYAAEVYCGRTVCGNGMFETIDECFAFVDDGFCDKLVITEYATGRKFTVKFEADKNKR